VLGGAAVAVAADARGGIASAQSASETNKKRSVLTREILSAASAAAPQSGRCRDARGDARTGQRKRERCEHG